MDPKKSVDRFSLPEKWWEKSSGLIRFWLKRDYYDLDWPKEDTSQLKGLIKALQDYPALQATGERHRLLTNNNHKFYSFTRTSRDGKQKMLVVLNFQNQTQEIITKIRKPMLPKDAFSHEKISAKEELQVVLPEYGYRIYEIIQEN